MKNAQTNNATTPAPEAVVANPTTITPPAVAPAVKRVAQSTPVINPATNLPYAAIKHVENVSTKQWAIVLGIINHYDNMPNAIAGTPAVAATDTTPAIAEVPGTSGASPEDRKRYDARIYTRTEIYKAMLALGRHSNPSWITKNDFLKVPGEKAGLIHVHKLQLDPLMGTPRPPKEKVAKTPKAPTVSEANPTALAAESNADGAIAIAEPPTTKSGRKGKSPVAANTADLVTTAAPSKKNAAPAPKASKGKKS